jgi:hypothetical protein
MILKDYRQVAIVVKTARWINVCTYGILINLCSIIKDETLSLTWFSSLLQTWVPPNSAINIAFFSSMSLS